jgi:amino acid transporter
VFLTNSYWDSASTLAGEVRDPSRTFPRALLGAVLLVVTSYLLPLIVGLGLGVGDDYKKWTAGYLAGIAAQVGGSGLAIWVISAAAGEEVITALPVFLPAFPTFNRLNTSFFSHSIFPTAHCCIFVPPFLFPLATVSNVGQFMAEMSSDSFQVLGMAERGFLPAVSTTV